MGFMEAVLRILGVIIALAFVLFLAWLLLRWMNKRVPGMGGLAAGRKLQVIDRVMLGKSGNLILVRVEDTVLLLGINDHAVEKLLEIHDPEGKYTLPEQQNIGFAQALKEAASKMKTGSKGEDTSQGGKE